MAPQWRPAMMLLNVILTVAAAFIVAWCATKLALPLLLKSGVLDIPNARSSHLAPTPRGGGVGIVAGLVGGLVAAWLLGLKLPGFELFLGVGLIVVVGFIDD